MASAGKWPRFRCLRERLVFLRWVVIFLFIIILFLSTEIVTHTLVLTEQSEVVGVKNGNLNSEVLQVESFLFLFHLFLLGFNFLYHD